MTHNPDDADSNRPDTPDAGEGSRKLDEDAAWRSIVENYGEQPTLDEPDTPSSLAQPTRPATEPEPVETPRWRDELNSRATWEDEGHFIPPTPPPLPPMEPRRRLAWIGLFGAPTLMLIAVVLGWSYPDWLMVGLVSGFVGGFVYLVATMQRKGPGDGSDDNGAVV